MTTIVDDLVWQAAYSRMNINGTCSTVRHHLHGCFLAPFLMPTHEVCRLAQEFTVLYTAVLQLILE